MNDVTWSAQQRERNYYVRFRTRFTFERFVPLPPEGRYRILDFGCGEGHSLEALLEIFPRARFVCADFMPTALNTFATHFGGHPRVELVRMAGPLDLKHIGDGYDVIQLNAVFEHLLPGERRPLMAELWRRLAPDGYFVVTETPWRWFPIETHTTSLPLVNYLPDRLALAAFRRCGRFAKTASLPEALREGLRGATAAEITAALDAPPGSAETVTSDSPDARDLLEVWWHGECRKTRQKRFAYRLLALLRRLTGITVSPWVNLVFRKHAAVVAERKSA